MHRPEARHTEPDPLVDLHAHYLARSVVEEVRRGAFGPHVRAVDAGDATRFSFPATTSRPLPRGMTGLQDRIDHLDQCGIDIQVLATWIDMFGYDLPEETSAQYHTRIN